MEADIKQQIEIMTTQKNKYKLPVHPYIILVGSIKYPKKYFVCINNVKYLVDSFIRALDLCFKAITALNCRYNFECHQIWEFIQIYFYGIKTTLDQKPKCVLNLLTDLKSETTKY